MSSELAERPKEAGFGKYLVYKSNDLVMASYKLTLHEQRLLLCCIAQLDSRWPTATQPSSKVRQGWFEVTLKNYVKTFPDCASSKSLSAELILAADQLYDRDIKITKENQDDVRMRWLGARVIKKSGAIHLKINDEVLPYLTELSGTFTKYYLKQAAELRQTYSIRIFEMLCQHRKKGLLKISLDQLVEQLELPYTRYVDVRRRVIEPAVAEITAKANMDISWIPIKTGKSVTSIQFEFGESAQGKLPFD